MISLMGNQPQRLSSHNAGWTFALKQLLLAKGYDEVVFLKQIDDIHGYDTICINNGINFKEGAWNFIGGPPKTLKNLLEQIAEYKGKLISFNDKIEFSDLVKSRKEFHPYTWPDKWPEVELYNTKDNGSKFILGDSHALSIFRPGWGISRNDGKTLFGALRDKGSWIKDIINNRPCDELHLYFGNIDIRFHLARQLAPYKSLVNLVFRYVELINDLHDQGLEKITVQGLLPIEDENRKIPGSGLYLKKPFFGTREERQDIVESFNKLMSDEARVNDNFTFLEWDFKSPLSFDVMEAKQSVHVRPEYYYFNEFVRTYTPVEDGVKQQSLF